MKSVTLKIGGMSCSACSNSLEKHLNKQPGIISASVNLVMQNATIEYEDHLSMNDLSNYISRCGFENQGIYKLKTSQENNHKKALLIAYGVLSIIYLYISMGHMINLPVPFLINMSLNPKGYGITLLILTIPYLILGIKIFIKGIKNIIYLHPNMDSLVTIGVITSFIYSLVNLILLLINKYNTAHNLYFESSAIVIYFVTLGRYIDSNAKAKTMEAIQDLVQITPSDVIVKENNQEVTKTIDEVKQGDILICKTGMKIGVDGVITKGSCHIDQAFITGESKPVKKEINSFVMAGSIVTNGYIEYIAEKIGKDSTISEVVRLVVSATSSKAKIARIADIICQYFVPSIILIAILSFIGHLIFQSPFNTAMNTFVSILVVACPCALGLATPLAIVISEGKLAKFGILVKKSEILEKAHKIDTVVFDKTGTLTYGKLQVSKIFNYKDESLMSIVCSIENYSSHPIAKAFIEYAKKNQTKNYEVSNFQEIAGIGLTATINDSTYYLGNNKLFNLLNIQNHHDFDEQILKSNNNSIIYVIENSQVIGLIGVSDIVRDNIQNVIKHLSDKQIDVIMLTGDNHEVATNIANSIGINHVISDVLPKEKVNVITELISKNKSVMMVGDGINDAPALATATIGVSINSGTDIAGNASDVILMNDDLSKIIDLISISKKTITNIKENLFWAFFYNVLMIPIAIGFFKSFGISMSPMIAGLGMTLSSLFVVFNALRLKRIKKEKI